MKAETGKVCVCAEQGIICKWCTLKLMRQAAATLPVMPDAGGLPPMTDEIKLPEPAWVWTKQPGNLQRILEGKTLLPEKGTALFTADQVRAAVLQAKREERERCERISLGERVDAAATGDATDAAYNVACEQIAAAIRSGHSITETQRAEE